MWSTFVGVTLPPGSADALAGPAKSTERKRVTRRTDAVLVAVALLLPAGPSAAGQPVTGSVRGTVLAADGSPAAGITVTVAVNPESALTPLGLVDTPTAFGARCAIPDVSRCGPTMAVRTDAAGRYEAVLDVAGDDLDDLAVLADLGDGRVAALRTRLAVAVRRELPTLRAWAPVVRPIPAVGGETPAERDLLEVQWLPLSPESGRGANYSVLFSDSRGEVWTFPDEAPGVVIDPRLLEDTAGEVRVDVESSEVYGADQVDFFFRSPAVAYTGSRGAPPSRGAACVPMIEPCRLSDGRFVPHTAAAVTVLRLQRLVEVELVTARGCPNPCQLEVSGDGVTWQTVGRAFAPMAAVPVRPPVRARFVRATFAGTPEVPRAPAELSVWEAGGPIGAPARPSRPADDDLLPAVRNALPVVALLSLIALLLVRSRRRRAVNQAE